MIEPVRLLEPSGAVALKYQYVSCGKYDLLGQTYSSSKIVTFPHHVSFVSILAVRSNPSMRRKMMAEYKRYHNVDTPGTTVVLSCALATLRMKTKVLPTLKANQSMSEKSPVPVIQPEFFKVK